MEPEPTIIKSRKFQYCALGILIGSFMYLYNIYLVTSFPFATIAYLNLFNTYIVFLAGIISGLTGCHFAMDWKNLQSNSTNLDEDVTQMEAQLLNPRREPKDYDVPLDQLN